jgi:two-component system chemotaxis response regulator CheB
MQKHIIVIGTSAGGIEALRALAHALPRDFPGSILAVQHTSSASPGVLAGILSRSGPLPATCVTDTEIIRPGRIYVPAPDHHLIVQSGVARATRGPKENRFRPAVDPLFRCAAQSCGPRVVDVILTGSLDDGTGGTLRGEEARRDRDRSGPAGRAVSVDAAQCVEARERRSLRALCRNCAAAGEAREGARRRKRSLESA